MSSSSITISTISGDDILNAAEAGSALPISGTTTNVTDGQTVFVDLFGNAYITTVTVGAWTLNVPASDLNHASLPDGNYPVTATVIDPTNGQAQTTRLLSVDETAPAPPGAPALAPGSDSGASDTDDVTKIGLPSFRGTGENGAIVTLFNGNTPIGTATVSGGTWAIGAITALNEGANSITATQTDVAGNTSSASSPLNVTLDTTALAPTTPVLAAGSDSGASTTDDITNATLPTFTGTGEDGATVTLLDGGTTIGTGTVTGGAWSITATTALNEGPNSITATQTDLAGNTSSASSPLNVTLDTTALTPDAPVLAAGSDSGASSTDDITNVMLPIFTGTGEDGATVTLLDGGTAIGTGVVTNGTWSITATTPLNEGPNSITATQTDVAGNISSASIPLSVTLDTIALPPGAPVLAAGFDSGASSTDDITNATLPIFTGTGENGATVTLLDSGTAIGTGVVTNGTWSITATTPLTEGSNSITATQTDVAGNSPSASIPLSVTLDTMPPMVTAILASDTGASLSDSVTSNGTLTGTGDANTVVTLTEGVTTIGTTTADDTGAWSLRPPLPDGTHTIIASETDTAGNTGSASVTFTLDTLAPTAPSAPDLLGSSDSGASDTDNLTKDTLPSFSGTGENGATVTLLDGITTIGTGTVSGGTWSITATTALNEGANSITAEQTDVAGNTSVASAALNVTLDTAAPAAPSTPDLLTLSDSGVSNTDNITNDILPVFSGIGENGATVTLRDGGAAIGTGTVSNGVWSIFTTTVLNEGANSITAEQTDVAGNTSVASSPLGVTLDTTAPVVTAALASDTGASLSDSVTNNGTLTGTGDANAVVTFTEGATQLGTTTADGTGVWNFTPTLSDGAHTIIASETDTAGNTGTTSVGFTLDTIAPVVTAALTSDTGASPTDSLTTNARLHGTADANAAVTLKEGATTIVTVNADGTGAWSYAPLLSDGQHTIIASETDTAGNTGTASVAFTLDSTAPAAPSTPDLVPLSDSGAFNTDNITNLGFPSFTGTGEDGATVTLLDNSTTIGTGTIAGGAWSITATTALSQGTNSITATQTDVAGNTSAASIPLSVFLDTVAPAAPSTPDLLALSDSGASSTDNVTNVRLPIFSGIGENGATVTLFDESTAIGTGTVTGGTWSIAATTALSEGANRISAKQTDVAGNISVASSPLVVTLDTVAPVVTAALRSDTGASAGDSITNNDTLHGTGDANAVVTLKEGPTTLGTAIANSMGTWSFAPTLSQAPHTITASETDTAGNTGSVSVAFTLDSIAPAAPSTPDLLAGSDSGASTTDNITNLGRPIFSGTGETGATLTLLDGSTIIGTGIVTAGAWSITATTALTEGSNSITATQTDVAGNISSASAALNVTLDTAAPVMTAALTSDTGASSIDSITSNDTLHGTGDPNAVVTFKDGLTPLATATADGTGAWSFTPMSLADGAHTITASETDAAGNTGTISVAFTLDTIAAAPSKPDLLAGSDSGTFSTDNITNLGLASFSGTGENGATVTLLDGITTIGTGIVTGGTWSITATTALTEGSNSITAKQTDVAGNISSASSSLSVTLDTTAPAAPGKPDLLASSDSGASSTDNITNVNRPSFSGSGENGATITLFDGSTIIGTGTVSGGVWSITAATALIEGANSITAKQTDVAGNTSGTAIRLNVNLDTTTPAVTAALTSDTGDSSSDSMTNNAALNGTGDANTVVTLMEGDTVLGTTTADDTGAWSFTPELADGEHTITSSETDTAGNTGTASVDFTLDTDAPAPPSTPVLAALSDSGASSTDNITNVSLPIFSGIGEDGATVTLLDGSTTIGTGRVSGGNWSITAATALSQGTNSITARQTDLAGNTSSSSDTLVATLDTVAPTVTALTASPSDATLQVGQAVSFTIGLSEAVTVNTTDGEPTLTLSDGATATYVSGSDTDALTFSYTVAAGQASPDLAVTGVDLNGSTITDAAGNAADLTGAAVNPPGTLTVAGVAPVAEFDAAYYLANNPDVAAAGVDPAEHYATEGWKEGRNPDAFFNTDYYLNQNPDVAAAGIDPLTHYETTGWKEGRDPSADFSTDAYLQANPDVAAAGIDPLLHYLEFGAPEGRMAFIAQPHGVGQQNPLVDNTYYFAHNPDVRAAGVNPFTQYDTFGWHEGRNPDALFNTTYYLQHNPDVAAAGVDPLLHYEQFGWLEGRNPSPDFSTTLYLNANPDVKAAGINPLVQYEEFGIKEGRAIFHV